jgi:nitrate reductase gamma subunit
MSLLTIAYTLLFYFATATIVVGLVYRIKLYASTPTPLRIPTTPAPTTAAGVVRRMFFEVTLFNSLFKSNKWIWLFGWVFHAALLFVLLRHLRYFTDPVWSWVALIQPVGAYAAFAMIAGLAGLWARRFLVDRVHYISSPSDHLMLALLIAIGLTGLGMKYVVHTDIVAVKAFFLGLMYFDWQPLPTDLLLNLHLLLVALLMIIVPFSKLLHVPGVFFSPTRNQIDNPREKRHLPTHPSATAKHSA